MIAGTVRPDGVPVVTLSLGGRDWTAIIDTGFSGDLELPTSLRPLVNARFLGQARSLLAGGQMIIEDIYLVDFPFDGQVVSAEATFVAGSEILPGTHLMRYHRLEVWFAAGTVLLER